MVEMIRHVIILTDRTVEILIKSITKGHENIIKCFWNFWCRSDNYSVTDIKLCNFTRYTFQGILLLLQFIVRENAIKYVNFVTRQFM